MKTTRLNLLTPAPTQRVNSRWFTLFAHRLNRFACRARPVAMLVSLLLPLHSLLGAEEPSLDALKARAEKGDPVAQHQMGRLHVRGEGVCQDYEAAARWFRRAARREHAPAQYELGRLYALGYGVPQNDREAVKWFHCAALQNHAPAQTGLGRMYANGCGVRRNYSEGLKWYHLAAAQGDALAQNLIGRMYQLGTGVPKDEVEAYRWFNLAAQQNSAVYAAANRDVLRQQLTPAQLATAEQEPAPFAVLSPANPLVRQ